MKIRTLSTITLLAAVSVTAISRAAAPQSSHVKSITLPSMEPSLPPGPGRDAAATGCVLCHSAQYIFMQPRFPRETWVAQVDKMRKTYGAPLTDDQAKQIVEDLTAVRRPEAPAPDKQSPTK